MYKLQVTRKNGDEVYIKIVDKVLTCWTIDTKGTPLPKEEAKKLKSIVDSTKGFAASKIIPG